MRCRSDTRRHGSGQAEAKLVCVEDNSSEAAGGFCQVVGASRAFGTPIAELSGATLDNATGSRTRLSTDLGLAQPRHFAPPLASRLQSSHTCPALGALA